MHTYTISEDNTIEVFGEGETVPFLRQPSYPNGDSFDTYEEAEAWVQLFLEALLDEDAPFAPIGKGLTGRPKPTKKETLEILKKRAEDLGDDVPEELTEKISKLEAELA
jgi:hypothetical protein